MIIKVNKTWFYKILGYVCIKGSLDVISSRPLVNNFPFLWARKRKKKKILTTISSSFLTYFSGILLVNDDNIITIYNYFTGNFTLSGVSKSCVHGCFLGKIGWGNPAWLSKISRKSSCSQFNCLLRWKFANSITKLRRAGRYLT